MMSLKIDHVLCLSHVFLHVSGWLVCMSSQFTFYSRLVYLLVEFWTVLPCVASLRCLRLKIEFLAFWGPACLRRKKWPMWVRFGQSLARLMILKCKHKCGLFCRGARWRVFVTWQGQLFIMFTVTGNWCCHARCRQIIVLEYHREILPWILWLCYICL